MSDSERSSPRQAPVSKGLPDTSDKPEREDEPRTSGADQYQNSPGAGKDNDRQERTRSRSPGADRSRDRPRRKDTGFKWKDKRRDDHERRDQDHGPRRGYRDQYRPRSRSRSPRRREGRDNHRERQHDRQGRHEDRERTEKTEVKKEKKPAAAVPQQNYILVYVNDRLGTKSAIPCFPTDTIKNFKAFVAAKIGRQPHEILIKRQGERPFKDILTLQDYGVSNGVQLDLEVDTGD